MFAKKKIAFVGTGAMAEAIVGGLLRQKLVTPAQIMGANPLAERNAWMAEQYGIETTTDNLAAIDGADFVVLSVKPQIFPQVLDEMRGKISADALVLSVMAGVTIETMVTGLNHARVARSMPNTPAMVGEGMTVWTVTEKVSAEQKTAAQSIYGSLGAEIFVDAEKYLDMATAISGSGPGYIFLLIEAMVDAGVHLGFARPVAEKLVMQTMAGSVAYAQQSDQHVAQLRNQVTSPGGTTAAGLSAMEQGNIRSTLANGIWAAYKRSVELGEK